VDLQTYRCSVKSIKYGKELPDALYLVRPEKEDVPLDIWNMICRAEVAARPDPSWNLLKLHTREVAMTFLTYSEFEVEPHPALAEATKINLNTGSIVRTDFRQRANPPILHRKEAFLSPNDPRTPGYAALTMQEEKAGLYRDPSRIGLRVQWLALLQRLNLHYEGHTLVSRSVQRHESESGNGDKPDIARHRTAIKRYDLSKPVKQVLLTTVFLSGEPSCPK
jgi:DNA phosphorothioation-associated putative methyltransferase